MKCGERVQQTPQTSVGNTWLPDTDYLFESRVYFVPRVFPSSASLVLSHLLSTILSTRRSIHRIFVTKYILPSAWFIITASPFRSQFHTQAYSMKVERAVLGCRRQTGHAPLHAHGNFLLYTEPKNRRLHLQATGRAASCVHNWGPKHGPTTTRLFATTWPPCDAGRRSCGPNRGCTNPRGSTRPEARTAGKDWRDRRAGAQSGQLQVQHHNQARLSRV